MANNMDGLQEVIIEATMVQEVVAWHHESSNIKIDVMKTIDLEWGDGNTRTNQLTMTKSLHAKAPCGSIVVYTLYKKRV